MPTVITGTDGINQVQAGAVEVGDIDPSGIVGTVSESGGVPTGAIIERGSNANGEYIKYADGTMIARAIGPSVNVSAGQSFLFAEQPWPASFVSMEDRKVICTSRSSNATNAVNFIIGVGSGFNQETNNTVVSVAMKNTSGSTLPARPNIFGVGQWY